MGSTARSRYEAFHGRGVREMKQVRFHRLEENDQLVLHRARVARVDYADFELQGDYAEFCRRRHAPFWGGA